MLPTDKPPSILSIQKHFPLLTNLVGDPTQAPNQNHQSFSLVTLRILALCTNPVLYTNHQFLGRSSMGKAELELKSHLSKVQNE